MNIYDRDEIDILLARLLPPGANPRIFTFDKDSRLIIEDMSADDFDNVLIELEKMELIARRSGDASSAVLTLEGTPQQIKDKLENRTLQHLAGMAPDDAELSVYRHRIEVELADFRPECLVVEFRQAADEDKRIYVGYGWRDETENQEILDRLRDLFPQPGITWQSPLDTHFSEFTGRLQPFNRD